MRQNMQKSITNLVIFISLILLAVIFMVPVALVLMNSFKYKLYISGDPFSFPSATTFAGLENYLTGLRTAGFAAAFGRSLFITVLSVAVLVLFSSMSAWYLLRVRSRLSRVLYYLFVFSMIVPFQMVMYTMTFTVNRLGLSNPVGIIPVYLGFGAGLSVFMMSCFIKSVPREIEEAATIDGASPVGTFFRVVFPILKPTTVTVAILNAMWIWNDYLLPYLVLGTDQKTVPVAIQIAMQGAYGATDYGGLMAMLVLAILPIVVFYAFGQKYIIKGVVAGAVKG